MDTLETKQDPVFVKDPWKTSVKDATDKAQVTSPSSSSTAKAISGGSSMASQGTPWSSDTRLSALASCMEQAERKHAELDTRVQRIDGKINNLNDTVTTRFEQVMQGLAVLASKEERSGEPPHKQRATEMGHTS